MNNSATPDHSLNAASTLDEHGGTQRFSPEWLKNRLSELLRNSPVTDLERNLKAVLNQGAQQVGLVTREEFEIRLELIERLSQRVASLEAELDQLRVGPMG